MEKNNIVRTHWKEKNNIVLASLDKKWIKAKGGVGTGRWYKIAQDRLPVSISTSLISTQDLQYRLITS